MENSGFGQWIWRHKILWLLLVSCVAVASDQLSKSWAESELTEQISTVQHIEENGKWNWEPVKQFVGNRTLVVIPNVFNLIYRENPAAAFSITSSLPSWFRRPFLLLVSLIATIFFIVWYMRMKEQSALLQTSFALILGGAVGNLIDRLRMGYVIDFLDIHAGFLGYPHSHWPTFNIADSCIVVGAIGILLTTTLSKRLQK